MASLIQRQAHSSENPTQFITTTFRPEMVAVASQCYGISHQNKVRVRARVLCVVPEFGGRFCLFAFVTSGFSRASVADVDRSVGSVRAFSTRVSVARMKQRVRMGRETCMLLPFTLCTKSPAPIVRCRE